MPDESPTAPLVMFGDPAAGVCDGDVCYLPSSATPPLTGPVTPADTASPADAPDGEDADRPG